MLAEESVLPKKYYSSANNIIYKLEGDNQQTNPYTCIMAVWMIMITVMLLTRECIQSRYSVGQFIF